MLRYKYKENIITLIFCTYTIILTSPNGNVIPRPLQYDYRYDEGVSNVNKSLT